MLNYCHELYFFGRVCEKLLYGVLFTCEQAISFYVLFMCVSVDFPMIGEAFLSILPKNQDWEWVLGTIGYALIGSSGCLHIFVTESI